MKAREIPPDPHGPHDAAAWATALVDGQAALPEAPDEASARLLGWALKDICYAAFRSEPSRAGQAAQTLADLAATCTGAVRTEVEALAAWTGGIAHVARGRMAEAVQAFDRAAAQFGGLGLASAAAQTQVPKIMALSMLGQHAQAADCAVATQQAFVTLGDVAAASRVSLNLGSLHLRHDEYAEAARHYREAAVLFSRVGDREHSVMADIGLGDALTALGQTDEAERIFARARARATAHDLPVLLALVDESMALLDLTRGRYGAALGGFESSRARYERLDMPQHLAIAEKQLADAYLELRLLPEALALHQQALAKFDALDMPDDRAWTLAQRGRALALMDRTAEAARAFADAADAFDAQDIGPGRAAIALARAELALARQDDAAAAQALAAQAQAGYAAAGNADGQARAQVLQAQALVRQGRHGAARDAFQAALDEARRSGRLSLQVRCLAGLGEATEALGDASSARAHYEDAIALFEAQRRALPGDDIRGAFLADHLMPYRACLRQALRAHDARPGPDTAASALQQVERARAQVLGDRVTGGSAAATPEGEAIDAMRARFNWLWRRARALQDDQAEVPPALWQALQRTEAMLLEHSRRQRLAGPADETDDDAGGRDDGLLPTAALQAALGADEALVEYALLDDELLAWVVRHDTVTLHRRLGAAGDLATALRSARFQIEALGHGGAPLTAHLDALTARAAARMARLHALVWAPLAPALSGAARVMVVAPGALSALPFAALHDGQAPLAARCAIAQAPSARLALHGLRRPPSAGRHAVLVAESSRLLHAADEVAAIAALLPGATCLVDADATVASLRLAAPGADILHLACHARFRHDNPAFSALHLHDGALTAELAARLALPPAIVVLSGCETARADGGEDAVGLVQAFLSAGAARVLASLWPVDDAVTRQFMATFYGELSQGVSAARALHLAQRRVMAHHPHPFYWAAFTLHGGF